MTQLHPTAARIAAKLGQHPDTVDPSALENWLRSNAAALNIAVAEAMGTHLRVVELFAGIGGLGLGLERSLDAITILQAEAVAQRRRVLAQHFPMALQLPDVKDVVSLEVPDDPDRLILSGGFPCRGASKANLTGPRGLAHPGTGLWWVMADRLRQWRPLALVWENVPSLVHRGLPKVIQDIDEAGYDAIWGTLKASDFGAPHERSRLFCVARRRDAQPVAIDTKEPDPRWFPWDALIPNNDPGRDDQSRRLKALGDAVLPIVGWAAGRTAARVLEGWWPSGGVPLRGSRLPMNGAQQNGQIVAFAESPFEVYPLTPSRGIFVTVDEEFMGSATNRTTAPMVGRILPHSFVPDLDPEDNVDIELPGGWTQPFPYGWTKPLWPTLTSNDGRNKGSRGQWRRRTKALNVLAQSNQCPRDEWAVVEVIVNMFAGQGVGPRFGEWVMGFPPGWTDLMGQDRHSSESLEPIKYMELR